MDLFSKRTAGLLLHPTSLPGPHGTGDLGPEAHRFLGFLESANLSTWQMLPIGPPGRSSSPYDATSAFAGSPALLSLVRLVELGLLREDDAPPFGSASGRSSGKRSPGAGADAGADAGTGAGADSGAGADTGAGSRESRGGRGALPAGGERVDLRAVWAYRLPRLRAACERAMAMPRWRRRLDAYRAEEGAWLEDHALFAALREVHRGRSWHRWDEALRTRRKPALREARSRHEERIRFHAFLQLLFHLQWKELRDQARRSGILLIGDLPIYVALESADVWSHPELFDLGPDSRPRTLTGVPPDYFNRNGQLWGSPTYRWERHSADDFAWWVSRFERTLRLFDNVRLDHFIGFHRGWTVPARARTARRGKWRPGPGRGLFEALGKTLGPVRLIAEDLGLVTPEVEQLRENCRFPGMRLLQFAFDGKPGNPNLPHNLPRECALYTGTHDNKTMMEWFRQDAPDTERRRVRDIRRERRIALEYLGSDGREFHWDLIRAAFSSVADTVVTPVQDVLGLGREARMNRPGTARNNWNWRLAPGSLQASHAQRLAELSRIYGRDERNA